MRLRASDWNGCPLQEDGLYSSARGMEEFNQNRHGVPQEKIVATFSTHRVFFS
jgi:hypothetical protein